jgi:predicted AlkP superfamily phosphohydrolase/phosphomutase
MSSNKILAIGLDAAEPSLIEKWMNDGSLKNLAALRAKGSFGKLATSADWLAGSPWPTFYTSQLPGKHGFYHYMQWKSDKMDYERPNPEWIPLNPFFRNLDNNLKVIAVDMPLTYPPEKFNGVEISGWASHDRIYPMSSYPEEKINWVVKKFGSPPISDEVGGPQPMDELLKIKEELIEANRKEGALASELIKADWDLFLCCFTSTHRGGHKFWDTTNVKGGYSPGQKEEFKNSLKEIYQSCDEAIGNILNNIDEKVIVFVFSLHGMGPNTTLADKLLPKMISNVLNGNTGSGKKENKSLIKKLRSAIPLEWRSNMRKLLPDAMQDKLTAYWRMGGINWERTKAFSLVADLQGYIRINLKGREVEGVVEKEEYDKICGKLIEGLNTFKDSEDSENVIEEIKRSDNIFEKGNGFDNLPDILVKWRQKPNASCKKIYSPDYGEIEFPSPGFNPDGRSGNHLPEGFLIAAGSSDTAGIKSSSSFEKKHIMDLAPTIMHLLGTQIPKTYEGEIIREIIEQK